jgi:diaminohydroxyphosphoribosylaminopyrimidine deaminase/5-amino-6-(5-phosphoribosylamino)uracil reductase
MLQSNYHLSIFVISMHAATQYMQRCLQLAQLGSGLTAPNPMVGAVLVYEDKIIGEGYHARYGGVHAEVDCLQRVLPENKQLIPSSTLYVSLEPCCHHGKTPPCTDLILQAQIKKVVVAAADPFPAVNSGGIRRLQAAGVEVELGLLEKESRWLNRRFFTFHEKHRPYIMLKWAQTKLGYMGGLKGERWQISNTMTQRMVHQWRCEAQSILVGYRTALLDDPKLTTRLVPGNNPLRFVIDPHGDLPQHLQVFRDGEPTIVFNQKEHRQSEAVTWWKYTGDTIFESMVAYCRTHAIQSILVEGGSATIQSFLAAGHWDEIRRITSPDREYKVGIAAPDMRGLKPQVSYLNKDDLLDIFYNSN